MCGVSVCVMCVWCVCVCVCVVLVNGGLREGGNAPLKHRGISG